MRERYVLLGLAAARAEWFRRVGHWASAAVLPVEFLRCMSGEEVRARLGSSRPFSALLVEGGLSALDRDLVATARAAGCAVVVVDDRGGRDWRALGAAAVLPGGFGREELLEVLAAHAEPVGAAVVEDEPAPTGRRAPAGRLIAVTGPGGTGASTVAIALAQGWARREVPLPPRAPDVAAGPEAARDGDAPAASDPQVLLADLRRAAEQAMLHDARVLVPGLQEVAEAHRTATPAPALLQDQTFEVPARGYRLLLGLRRPRHWVGLRPRALEATLDSLQRLADVVVADVDPDVEGEAETGSYDVEERNLLARAPLARADAVVVVGQPSMKGLYAQVRLIAELLAFGVPAARLIGVCNRSPRSPRARAELQQAFARLLEATTGAAGGALPSLTHLPERRVDEALRDGAPLPRPLPQTTARAVGAVLARSGEREPACEPTPRPVVAGGAGDDPTEGVP